MKQLYTHSQLNRVSCKKRKGISSAAERPSINVQLLAFNMNDSYHYVWLKKMCTEYTKKLINWTLHHTLSKNITNELWSEKMRVICLKAPLSIQNYIHIDVHVKNIKNAKAKQCLARDEVKTERERCDYCSRTVCVVPVCKCLSKQPNKKANERTGNWMHSIYFDKCRKNRRRKVVWFVLCVQIF